MSKALVTGEILLPAGADLKPGALARVQLLDTSLADAASVEVANQLVSGLAARLAKGETVVHNEKNNFNITSGRTNFCFIWTIPWLGGQFIYIY